MKTKSKTKINNNSMKMNLLGAAAFSLLLVATSCDNEIVESANVMGDNQIKFQTVLGKQTKATEFIYWDNGQSFPVKLYGGGTTTTDSLYRWTLTNNGTVETPTWSYGTAIGQPGYAIKYYAWYPATNVPYLNATSNGVSATFDYEVPAVASQEDLVVAIDSTASTGVTLAFNHVLSQVNFAIQGVTGLKVKIENISVNTVINKGTYTFPTKNESGKWALGANTASYAYSSYDGISAYGTSYTTTGSDPNRVYLGNGGTIKTRTNALMLMPQSFGSSNTANFSFSYTLYNISGAQLTTGTSSAYLRDFDVSEWLQGKRYLYVIDFSNYYVSGGNISFTVSVADWESATEPYNYVAQSLQVTQATAESIKAAINTHNSADNTTTALSKFPISVTVDATAAITLEDFTDTAFDAGDQIIINFTSTNGRNGQTVSLGTNSAAKWTISGEATNIVTLTRKP